MDDFVLGTPALVCRWRLFNRQLPLKNRHFRALAARRVQGRPLAEPLVAWVRQHIEWTLEDGAQEHPEGTLMLVVDEQGRAAMSVGAYEALPHASANDLLQRAKMSWREAEVSGVSPEDLWLVRGSTLVWGASPEFAPSATSSLISDLAHTLGMPVVRDEDLLEISTVQGFMADEVFLVSDEHGVVPASDRAGMRASKFAGSYEKLLRSSLARERSGA